MSTGFNWDAPWLEQTVTPATPDAGKQKIYPKSDSVWYQLDATGAETPLGSGGSSSFVNLSLTGTAGAGFAELLAQASFPSAPAAAGARLTANASGYLSWVEKVGSDVFARTLAGVLTANRVYTLPDYNGTLATLAGVESLTNKKLGSLTTNGLVATGSGDGTLSAVTTSAGLAALVSDETGTGALVFGTAPTLTATPLTLAYDGSHSTALTVSSTGALTVTPQAGTNLNIALSTTGDFAVNTSQLYVDTSAAFVGVNTATPAEALHVLAVGTGAVRIDSATADATNKFGRFVTGHYTNAEESLLIISGVVVAASSTVLVGGGSSIYNTAMFLDFYTAADTTTLTGTRRLRIDASGHAAFGDGLITVSTARVLVQAEANTVKGLVVKGVASQTTLNIFEVQSDAAAVNFGVNNSGGLTVPATITAPGTTGNQTINKPAGRVNIAAAGTTITVTNSLVSANSMILVTIAKNDTTARIANVVAAAGSFVINIVATTAEVSIDFLVIA